MKKPSYGNLALNLTEDRPPDRPRVEPTGDKLKDVSAHIMTYISPEAHKAFARYALEKSSPRNKYRLHDICIEALQDWADKHGLNVTVRAK